jgi:hypothetical protein
MATSSVKSRKSGCEEDFMCAVVQSYLECGIHCDCYTSCVKIRCHVMASEDSNRLRTLVSVTVNCKVWR